MTDSVGPIFAAGFQHIVSGGWEILYLPDLHNDELQKEGKAPVYWWLPNEVRLARRDGDTGDFKFSFIHFEGVRTADTNVGATADAEVAGGLLGFSTTASPPASVLQASQDELLNRFRGSDDKYWGWRTSVAPEFRPAPIVSNTTSITNLSPGSDGTVPAVTTPAPGGTAPASGGAPPSAPPAVNGPPPGRSAPPSVPSRAARSIPPAIRAVAPPRFVAARGTVPVSRGMRDSNLDMWYANLQGQGSGSVSPFAENAYSGLVGSMPALLIWSSFHGGTGGISVWQKLRVKVWSPAVHIRIHGDWSRIQAHLSAEAKYGGVFWQADLQAEFNLMRQQGTISVVCEIDTTIPGADKLQEEMDKRSDLVFQKFMDEAQKAIFDPAPFTEKPAEASGGFLGFGGGVAVKLRADVTAVSLDYESRTEIAYLQEWPISGQLQGMYDEIKADPTAERKYFSTVDVGDWDRAVVRVVKPVANYAKPEEQWAGEPVAFMSVQTGYPNAEGVVEWDGHIFQAGDGPDALWSMKTAMKQVGDVQNAPAGWTPDKTFVKRMVHLSEPASALADPYTRVQVEKNVIEIDPGDLGTLTSDINLEVRADTVGTLSVGPILLDATLQDATQIVEVTMQPTEPRADGARRDPVKFSFGFDDQKRFRAWMLYTGDPAFTPRYRYQVRVIVTGSIFTHGMEWTGPEVETSASGPIMIHVPTSDEQGVTKRALPSLGAASTPPSPATAHTPPPRSAAPSGSMAFDGWTFGTGRSAPPAAIPAATRNGNEDHVVFEHLGVGR